MGFLDPRNPEIPNARTKSGEFLGPKLSTPTILPIRAKTGFWGEFFGPLFWLFLGFFFIWLRIGGRIDYIIYIYWEPRAHVSWIGLRQRPMIYHTLWFGSKLLQPPYNVKKHPYSFCCLRIDYGQEWPRTDTQLCGRGCLAQLDVRKERSSSKWVNYMKINYSHRFAPLRYTIYSFL
jgi:hypothetical protein